MKYKVIEARDYPIYLEKEVNELLEDGWELVGGVSVSAYEESSGITFLYLQAMCKK